MTSGSDCVMIFEKVARQRNVFHKFSSSDIIEKMCSEHGFAMNLKSVVRIRHMTSIYGVVEIFQDFTRQRNVLHELSSSKVIESICSEYGFAIGFERAARMTHVTSSKSVSRDMCPIGSQAQKSLEVYALVMVLQWNLKGLPKRDV